MFRNSLLGPDLSGFSLHTAPGLRSTALFAAGAALAILCGCGPAGAWRPAAYDIDVHLDPARHRLVGRTTMTLKRTPAHAAGRRAILEFTLNRALDVTGLRCPDAKILEHVVRKPDSDQEASEPTTDSLLVVHRLVLSEAPPTCTLTFDYAGELFQDVNAGERVGQIHNFAMAAHIAPEGIYLDAGGGWYPRPCQAADEDAPPHLADYHLAADPVPGMRLVAGAAFDAQESQRTGRLAWRSRYPLDSLVLVGGPHEVLEQRLGDLVLALHYSPPSDPQARSRTERTVSMFLAAAAKYLARYQPLIGPYPFDRFTIVENFFSSGFAFPEFTLLDRRLLQMGPRALRHGMLDHEMLHAWWGNSVYVDPRDGNWCEALTSYCTNYYGYLLDEDPEGARRYRRNACTSFSLLAPEEDLPLDTFGRPDGAGRDIGYQKGAMVFHMLARQIGQDNFWAALRDVTARYTGRYADWKTFQDAFERHGGQDLDRFFRQWVRGAGAPQLRLVQAEWNEARSTLDVILDQGDKTFDLSVPLRITTADGETLERLVALHRRETKVALPLPARPRAVTLDPDYQVLRRLPPTEIMPTSGLTRAGDSLLVIQPQEQINRFFETAVELFGRGKAPPAVIRKTPDEVTDALLSGHPLLILGSAVQHPRIQALLNRAGCPVTWHEGGFEVEGERYDQPGHAVMVTMHHPDDPRVGITVYYGNSEDALGRSDLLLFYRNSLVVFETSIRQTAGEKQYSSRVVDRRDYESPQTIRLAE